MIQNETEQYDPEYIYPQIYVQCGKILDSEGNPNELSEVYTDDGWCYNIEMDKARAIMGLIMKVPVKYRNQFCKSIQYSEGFERMLGYIK